jgi:predicted MFS family arabinose efflux permease
MRRVHYAWVMAALTFVVILASAGFRSAPGVLFEPLEDDFGWSKATVGAAVSVNLLLYGLIGPFAAASMQRFGLRRHIVGALLLQAIGAVSTLVMTSPLHLALAWGVLLGAGSGAIASVLAATVATRWFVARRGIVMGALTAAGATGQLVFLPLLSNIADEHGWKPVSMVVAVGSLIALPIAAIGFRNAPADLGLAPYGGTEVVPVSVRANPIQTAFEGLRSARRTGAFWLLFGSFAVCGLSTNGLIGTHFIPAGHDHGLNETTAAGYLALIGIFDIAGTVASGALVDRVDPRKLLMAYYAFRGLSLLVLHQAFERAGLTLLGFIVLYGLDWVATVPPTVALCTRVFGIDRGAVVYGWVFAGHQIGAAIAAAGAGLIRDITGSYQLAFVISGAFCVAAAFGVMRIRLDPTEPQAPLADSDIPFHPETAQLHP